MDINTIENKIRKEATTVLWRVVLFIVYYIVLILCGIGLFFAAFGVTWLLIHALSETSHINLRFIVVIFMLWLAMWWFCIQISWYLIKPLFTFHKRSNENRFEVKRADCPELFSLIEDVAKSTGNKMPKHVYLTAEVNACVFYNSTSIWAIFFPTRKNLMVGLGLLQGMNKDEVKAILGHEFGHFSQQTMRVGSISYRLLLIISDMIHHAQEQQRSAALSWASDSTWAKVFHLASGPISFITGKTIDFYNYIEKKNRSLSRLMEFEADAVACRTVGAKPFISSLCKLSVLSGRFNIYENLIYNLVSEKQCIKEYWQGYDFVESLISKDEQLQITYKDIYESELGDEAHHPSKVKVVDGWNTHPSTEERIENARQFLDSGKTIDQTDARTIIPLCTMNEVGMIKQKFTVDKIVQESVDWSLVKEISMEDFKVWAEKELNEYQPPHFIYPFIQKNVVSFSLPSLEELQEPVETPFTIENREMMLEFRQGITDWQILNKIKSNDSEVEHFMYNGQEYKDISEAINHHQIYLEPLNKKVKELDIQIYKYLYQRAKNKTNVNVLYWALFFSHDALNAMNDIIVTVNAIREQAEFYNANGQGFSLRNDVLAQLTHDFWEFMRQFDYNNISHICGNWQNGKDTTVNQQLKNWHDFASKEKPPYLDTSDLFRMIDEVYNLLDDLCTIGKKQWNQRVINAYYDIEEAEDPEPPADEYEDIWDESLEIVSEAEKIRYKIYDYLSGVKKGQSVSATDVFGEGSIPPEEYIEFLHVMTRLIAFPSFYDSKEDLDKAIAELNETPDAQTLNKIGYTYMVDVGVEPDYVESTKWFMKAAELNDAEALDRVGGAYFNGSGVEKDLVKAVNYYKKSIVAGGFDFALLDLGLAYLKGEGVPRNVEHGYSLMIRAAKQGNAPAQYNMGRIYHMGLGVDANMDEALKWYRMSAAQDYEQAIEWLKKLEE